MRANKGVQKIYRLARGCFIGGALQASSAANLAGGAPADMESFPSFWVLLGTRFLESRTAARAKIETRKIFITNDVINSPN